MTTREGSLKPSLGTSFSSPMICGLIVLVRCLIDYFIEKEGAPEYLRSTEMIKNIIQESCIKISDGEYNKFYTKFDQGNGFPTLFNVYKYLRTQNKNIFSCNFMNKSLIKKLIIHMKNKIQNVRMNIKVLIIMNV